MMSAMTPEQRVGKTANLVIFLGILYTILNLVALLGNAGLAARGFGGFGLLTALVMMGLGYGMRYCSMTCLYMGISVFALFAGVFLVKVVNNATLLQLLRLLLSLWTLYVLCRTVPDLRVLQQTASKPIRTSPYAELVWRRWRQ